MFALPKNFLESDKLNCYQKKKLESFETKAESFQKKSGIDRKSSTKNFQALFSFLALLQFLFLSFKVEAQRFKAIPEMTGGTVK